MNYIGNLLSNFKEVYNEINGATLTGAIDAVVVRQEDGSYVSSPFHVRFGKIGVLRSKEKVVDIEINGNPVDIHMKLGDTGEAFFVQEIDEGDEISSILGTSPLPTSFLEDEIHSLDNNALESFRDETDSHITPSANLSQVVKDETLLQQESELSKNENSIEPNGDDINTPLLVTASTISSSPSSTALSIDKSTSNILPSDMNAGNSLPSNSNDVLVPSNSSSVDVPTYRILEEIVRSKSLTNETSLLEASTIIVEGQGSKTDGEDVIKFPVRNPRRKKRRRAQSKKARVKTTESQSSDTSTTSELADLSSLTVTAPIEPIFFMEDVENNTQNATSTAATEYNNYDTSAKKEWTSHRTLGPDFHPFSDTDISPPPSSNNSRSQTPVKSDTEYEYAKQKSELSEKTQDLLRDSKWSWTWGELPTPPQSSISNVPSRQGFNSPVETPTEQNAKLAEDDVKRSMLGNMFSFMRATKNARHKPHKDGIYLDDLGKLDEIDPEVAALYFPRNLFLDNRYTGFQTVSKDEDVESGNGTSLPQSPHSFEGAVGGLKISESDFEENASKHFLAHFKCFKDLAFSMCGALHDHTEDPFPEILFMQSLVTYDDFCEKPDLLSNPNLVVRFQGRYMNWNTAIPQIMSRLLFQRSLPIKVVENLEETHMPKKEMRKQATSKRLSSWFPSWGRNNENQLKPQEEPDKSVEMFTEVSSVEAEEHQEEIKKEVENENNNNNNEELEETTKDLTKDENKNNMEEVKQRTRNDSSGSELDEDKNPGRYKKSLRLSSEQIEKLNLRNGSNEVIFSVTTAYQGTTRCMCHIYLWNYDENIVISDIDGTITRSDVLGQILPIIGKDWAQGGVAQLFTKIKNNGYNFLYLSARAIGQAKTTREYLRSVKQGDVNLPVGPLLLNPTSLIQAFHREVIEKKPEEFKISCLRDIKALFPPNRNPFYAGYGNKINDVWAYRAVGIPISRIFTINHKGELKHELTQAFQSTYSNLTDIAHHMFPPVNDRNFLGEFSSLNYWRLPLPDYSDEIEEEIAKATKK